MPSRRTVLETLGTGTVCALAGCSVGGRPEVRMDGGVGVLHPAGDRYIANGLQPDGNDNAYATITLDRAPDVVGPDASDSVAGRLRTATGVFHAIVELRSTPEGPIQLSIDDIGWRGRDTLVLGVTVAPWGSLSRIDDTEDRERLESADELVYTTVWSLTPKLDTLPTKLDLSITHRER